MSGLMGKKLLVLGANPETASLVKKANQMGVRTIVTDYNPDAYAKSFAWKALNIDAADVDALEGVARSLGIDGVCVGVAEALLPAYCELCQRLGLPAFSNLAVFTTLTNKDKFKDLCRKFGVPVPEEYLSDSIPQEAYPVVVKPADACSSKGISVCYSSEGLGDSLLRAREASKSRRVIVEKMLDGQEIVMYYAAQQGNAFPVAMCDRYTWRRSPEAIQLPTAYIFPSLYLPSALEQVDDCVRKMMCGVGIQNGTIFLQGFACSDGAIRFYEPGYRLNGAQEHMILGPITGVDAKEMYIRFALTGRVADYDLASLADANIHGKYACKLSPLIRVGKIGRIEGLERISQMEGVLSVNPSYRPGDEVTGEDTLRQIACRFFIIADTPSELAQRIDEIHQVFRVVDQEGSDMLVGRFDTSLLERY